MIKINILTQKDWDDFYEDLKDPKKKKDIYWLCNKLILKNRFLVEKTNNAAFDHKYKFVIPIEVVEEILDVIKKFKLNESTTWR